MGRCGGAPGTALGRRRRGGPAGPPPIGGPGGGAPRSPQRLVRLWKSIRVVVRGETESPPPVAAVTTLDATSQRVRTNRGG